MPTSDTCVVSFMFRPRLLARNHRKRRRRTRDSHLPNVKTNMGGTPRQWTTWPLDYCRYLLLEIHVEITEWKLIGMYQIDPFLGVGFVINGARVFLPLRADIGR